MIRNPSRREWLAGASSALGASLAAAKGPTKEEPFGYCLNTSTIEGQKLSLVEKIEIAGKVGYSGIEPWVRELDLYARNGGNLKALAGRIRDFGLVVPSAIDFFEWIVDDERRRKKGLEQARRGMDLVRQIGGQRIAAPPAGATSQAIDLFAAARRYRELIEAGAASGVVPEVEFWGPSRTLSRLGEAVLVAIESGHPDACILPDVFHMYRGRSNMRGFRLVAGSALHVIHFNDYPSQPPRETINDAQRVYPGDGVAPLKDLVRDLHQSGFRGMLSLELFNREYWKQDPVVVARTGLEKMRSVVRGSLG
jgi:sugar phosphate isomerase/epimerase